MNPEEPVNKLLKVVTGFIFFSGIIVSIVGLLLLVEVNAMGRSRETGFLSLRNEIRGLKDNQNSAHHDISRWREEVNQKLEELSKKVNEQTEPKE